MNGISCVYTGVTVDTLEIQHDPEAHVCQLENRVSLLKFLSRPVFSRSSYHIHCGIKMFSFSETRFYVSIKHLYIGVVQTALWKKFSCCKLKQGKRVLVETVDMAAGHGLFSRICQVVPMCTASST